MGRPCFTQDRDRQIGHHKSEPPHNFLISLKQKVVLQKIRAGNSNCLRNAKMVEPGNLWPHGSGSKKRATSSTDGPRKRRMGPPTHRVQLDSGRYIMTQKKRKTGCGRRGRTFKSAISKLALCWIDCHGCKTYCTL